MKHKFFPRSVQEIRWDQYMYKNIDQLCNVILSESHIAPNKKGDHCNNPHAGHCVFYKKTCILSCSVWFCHCYINNDAHTFWKAVKQHRHIWMKRWLGTDCITYCVSFAPCINCIFCRSCRISVWEETTSIRKRRFSNAYGGGFVVGSKYHHSCSNITAMRHTTYLKSRHVAE